MRHLLGLQLLPATDLRELLSRTQRAKAGPAASDPLASRPLAGRLVANLFFEDSTRTRNSFTAAAYALGAQVIDLLGSSSSVNKGETLIDTARNVEAMGVAAMCVRAKQSGSAAMIAKGSGCPVINAGDGKHEHPTQGLLDLFTIAESFDRLGSFDLSGLRVGIVGDVASSRVARSAIAGLLTLGATVTVVGPPGLVPGGLASAASHDLDEVLPTLDAVMMLRIQFERHSDAPPPQGAAVSRGSSIASVREFRSFYALTAEREARMKPHAIIMHPGPINRGIELDADVADGPRSVILRQVSNGVFARTAALAWCCEAH